MAVLVPPADCYMMENPEEYWAEATQAWFGATARTDVNSGINNRQLLQQHDPGLAKLVLEVRGRMLVAHVYIAWVHMCMSVFGVSENMPACRSHSNPAPSQHGALYIASSHPMQKKPRTDHVVVVVLWLSAAAGCPGVWWQYMAVHRHMPR